MPYIEQETRDELSFTLTRHPRNPGELTYLLCEVIKSYMDDLPLSFSDLCNVIGAVECAKREFQRTVVDPYEEYKRTQNGDIWGKPSECR
jgi:hypothetical protein